MTAQVIRMPVKVRVDVKPVKKKIRRQMLPDGIALDYYRQLREMVLAMDKAVKDHVITALPRIIDLASYLRPDHADTDYPDEINNAMNAAESAFARQYPAQVLTALVGSVSLQLSDFNRRQVQLVIKSAIGLDVFIHEPWLKAEMKSFTRENVRLITSVSTRYFDEVETLVQRGVRAGLRHEEIAKQIEKRTGVARSRAKVIARDQCNKFNGQLTMLRQTALGVEKYTWRTAGDQRVRPRHKDREGREYSWKDPPSGGHPGEDIQCRCTAEPVINAATISGGQGLPIAA